MKEITNRLAGERAVLVTVDRTEGSAPREPGAWMAVFPDDVFGTIGGGHVEFEAIGEARRRLAGGEGPAQQRFALGPSLGQCCGGVMFLAYELLDASNVNALQSRLATNQAPVALFGGGHVGRAIVQALGPLPFAVTWIDSRDEIFPAEVPANVQCEHSDPVEAAVKDLAPASRVLVMSFSHAEDLDIAAACLKRADLPFIGLIGSKTKWATFRHRLEARGFTPEELARVTCPIGVPGVVGKEPEVIAAAVAAQLLQIPR
ncbi:xanthine dehydrogenase accessory protein XdhC [Ramlibacter albus]|uniref:Xanthine dehydrogenase accessory protein XdhC n=1 Tax=Ramlibacter albus TaxID=2079448 RepID=A0A923M6M4_9BURK|nr:xanthine dehydrogenase accessory protein XdhC [Ramlibacter albus]MBC5765207.1 xanthine dehydrogenase accessory protein XdhC [Ramlibacter albus]